jgi:pantoate--beta-alanine ligase
VRTTLAQARAAGRSIAFVPTMGALHAGHVSLVEAARKDRKAFVVVSIYVNPTQFGPQEDLQKYPRTLDADRATCAKAGADLIFAPRDDEIYPPGDQTRVHPGPLAAGLCGAFRPGHFEGVCTVVAKLFSIVQPDIAYFGQKDAQQAVIIKRMVKDLCMPIRIEVCPLIRDPDGLAMSSRNARLSIEDRSKALSLYESLSRGKQMLTEGGHTTGQILAAMRAIISAKGDISVDYLAIVDPETLVELDKPAGRVMLAGALHVGDVRLIDNLLVDLPPNPR